MDTDERLSALEAAFKELSAQHAALLETCKVMLPLIPTTRDAAQKALTGAYDGISRHMEATDTDTDYQQAVRHWIDYLSTLILNGPRAYIAEKPRTRD